MSRSAQLSAELVTQVDPMSSASEAFRVLRTNLQFMGLDRPLKTLLVTSATPSEGKSTVAANLAIAFAQAGGSVCLVDADLRRPRIAKIFGVDNWKGLTNAVVSLNGLEGYLTLAPRVAGLTLLTSGPVPPNPAEVLASARMGLLLENLRDRFDTLIVDTPPLLAVTDAAVLAPKADGVLMVVRSGHVARKQTARAKEALEAVKARVLGTVLTAVEAEGHEGYYYYTYN